MSVVETPLVQECLTALQSAVVKGQLSADACKNIQTWLTEPRYAQYVASVIEHIQQERWQALDDAFWTIIPFGTGGRRGRMYPIGSNAINDRTIGESAQGLAEYLLELEPNKTDRKCAIAYDTRHNSRHFAEWCASIMVAHGFHVYFIDDYRATPQLSMAVRMKGCDCGIMVTASHNPPSDNAVKVYWSTGGQILPPHDQAIIDRVMSVGEIKSVPFAEALQAGKVEFITAEIDAAYLKAAGAFAWPGARDVRILYSPLHGVGSFAVLPLLQQAGFQDVEVFGPHAEPNGDFPNVPGHVSNPENAIVFDAMIEHAQKHGQDLILATDPDCDRMGCAAKLTPRDSSPWKTLNGNQLGAVLTDFVLRKRKELGDLTPQHFVVKTLVTTELLRKICHRYGVRCEGNIHVGFKWIAGLTDALGPSLFAFGTEESHGFTIGEYARDKDGAVACLLMAQLAADLKAHGRTLHQYLDDLLREHGCHLEDVLNLQMEGSQGMTLMKKLMQSFRTQPPQSLGGIAVKQVRDYASLEIREPGTAPRKLDAPASNMVIMDLAEPGNYVAVRPSGTEPKVKFYFFTALSPEASVDLEKAKALLQARIDAMRSDLRAFASQQS